MNAIAGLTPIHLHLDKISERHHLRIVSLPKQYAINSLLDNHHSKKAKHYCLSIGNFTDRQWLKIKSSIVDTNNYLNKVYLSFNILYKDLLPGFHLVDNFPNHFSFYTVNWKNIENMNAHIWSLDKLLEDYSLNPNIVLIISNPSVRNNIATSISHIHSNYSFLLKTTYHAINVMNLFLRVGNKNNSCIRETQENSR